MIIESLGLLDDAVLTTTAWIKSATTVSSFSYDTAAAGGGTGNLANTSTTTGTGGGGAGQSPMPLSPPSATAGPIGGPLLHDIGRGRPVQILQQVGTTAALTGVGVEYQFITTTGADLTGSVLVLGSTSKILVAKLILGYRFPTFVFPKKVSQRYIGVQAVLADATSFTGTATITNSLFTAQDDHADILGAQ